MIYILIPVFNEAENIPLLAQNLIESLPGEHKYYVFVDDCSTDRTIALIQKHFDGKPLQIITKTANGGPGDSFNKGFDWILSHSTSSSDLVVTMEGDNTSDIGILFTMLTLSRLGFDLILASIYAQGGYFRRTSFLRKSLSALANAIIRLIFDLKVLTLSSFYRIYSVPLLAKIKEKHTVIITEKGYISMVEVLLRAIRVNARIIEVPMILDSSKRKGSSKMKIIKTTKNYIFFLLKNIRR
ncbi:MAG: glycosyltransferase family 2 protein [Bacteroidia bacterium]